MMSRQTTRPPTRKSTMTPTWPMAWKSTWVLTRMLTWMLTSTPPPPRPRSRVASPLTTSAWALSVTTACEFSPSGWAPRSSRSSTARAGPSGRRPAACPPSSPWAASGARGSPRPPTSRRDRTRLDGEVGSTSEPGGIERACWRAREEGRGGTRAARRRRTPRRRRRDRDRMRRRCARRERPPPRAPPPTTTSEGCEPARARARAAARARARASASARVEARGARAGARARARTRRDGS